MSPVPRIGPMAVCWPGLIPAGGWRWWDQVIILLPPFLLHISHIYICTACTAICRDPQVLQLVKAAPPVMEPLLLPAPASRS